MGDALVAIDANLPQYPVIDNVILKPCACLVGEQWITNPYMKCKANNLERNLRPSGVSTEGEAYISALSG